MKYCVCKLGPFFLFTFQFEYLKDNNFPVISLEVERPCGSDEAVGLTHDVVPKSSDQSQRVQHVYSGQHRFQLQKNKQTKNSHSNLLYIMYMHLSNCCIVIHTWSWRCSANGS